ncbi:hypothetical protein GCM10010464_18380 [Pseudonocardia yunnanensis]|uniref:DUF1918 domain-containing protein n=1 Tax=Pseudonocardia yunnanensis TaxID=58107 RepID=A0ABW4EW14_9PSEU
MTAEEASLAGGRDVYWFVGGPLDGRVHTREPSEPAPCTVRYTHLHDGPKIVHHYDLHEVAGHGGEYRLRPPHAPGVVDDDVDDGEDYDGDPRDPAGDTG